MKAVSFSKWKTLQQTLQTEKNDLKLWKMFYLTPENRRLVKRICVVFMAVVQTQGLCLQETFDL